ncbi:hypothetical protein DNTS_032995 [Danionella cerebrum]|uniref:Voltage-dependent calcium channel alpha-2/delta subunit conserved region domain-containing protein n=1 Tax=Danionella cerebrum TaxID=2873325 RepID=A0A553QY74_9TELE|nr:hypothetical protein DNTS_032995 [Danionella translucida]
MNGWMDGEKVPELLTGQGEQIPIVGSMVGASLDNVIALYNNPVYMHTVQCGLYPLARELHKHSSDYVCKCELKSERFVLICQQLGENKGPNPMTTVAMPVFSTKNETKNQGILLGVAGTDIPIQELMKVIPKHKLGIHGYAFAITSNGYILMHPDLRPLYQEGQKRKKPSYSSVDLSEVEWEDTEDFLRTAMVNRKTGTFSMEVKRTVDKGKRVLTMHNDYYYTDIKGTPFSVGVTLSRGHGKFFFKGNVSLEAGLHDLEQPDVALADEWTYCNTDEHHEHRHLTQVQAIKMYMTTRKTHFKLLPELAQTAPATIQMHVSASSSSLFLCFNQPLADGALPALKRCDGQRQSMRRMVTTLLRECFTTIWLNQTPTTPQRISQVDPHQKPLCAIDFTPRLAYDESSSAPALPGTSSDPVDAIHAKGHDPQSSNSDLLPSRGSMSCFGTGSVSDALESPNGFRVRGDRELIQQVLFDAVVTAPVEAYWTGLALNKSENSDKGVEIAFLGTRTGLSRTNLFVVPEQLTNRDFLTAEDKEGVFNADHFPLWYKRAAEQVPGTFVYSIPFSSGGENKSVVLASTAIQLLDDRKSPIVAAVGIQMKLEFFQRKFWTASRQCNTLDGKCAISCDNEEIKCYLIDNNGFILVSEDTSQTNLFFGEVEGAVMNKLLVMGSFKKINLYDYQALCKEYAGSSDSARTLLDPFTAVKWLLTELVIFLLEFNLYSWWNCETIVKAQRSQRTMMVPCDTEYPAFVSERTIKETTGNIDCGGCIRTFVIQQIPSSNLFMVVVENKCDCDSAPSVTMEPIEIIYILPKQLKFQKDRRRPQSCHPFHPEENAMECGSANTLSFTLVAIAFPVLSFVISR